MSRSPRRRRRAKPGAADLINVAKLRAELAKLSEQHQGRAADIRVALTQRLKTALTEGRELAEKKLLGGLAGRGCAEALSRLMDTIITLAYEVAAEQLYRSENPSTAERMTVVAVGGYGRGLLAPGSDIDLLFLLPYKQTAWGESVAEAILYALWDMGLKVGHATRSVDECIRQGRADMTIRTALLEARRLVGDEKLFDEFQIRFDKEVVQGTAAEFVAAKLAERDERHKRAGQSRYLVEPNVKEGKGGLRDLHTLNWIGKYVYRVRDVEELVGKGLFTKAERALFRRCADFLWAVRCHLHFLTGRAEERLSFEVQHEMALRLGYTDHPGQRDVERFMKHYFLIAKDVGDLTAIVCAELEEIHAKSAPALTRVISRFARRKRRPVKDYPDFVIDNERVSVANDKVFQRDPVNFLRMFHIADQHDLDFHPDALRLARRSLKLIDGALREDPDANTLFREIVASKHAPEIVLRKMNEAGVLGRFVPEFGHVVAMMQFNLYHHYTVDEHLIRCIGVLSEIERGTNPEYGLANELMKTIKNRELLYIALFLHDIAKGRPEDHSIMGAKIARRFCPRIGLSQADTETIAWLIEQHLTMSTIAQSRDLSDRKTVEGFAAIVQNLERLKMLLILTTADIRAVGPGVWNGWKAQLLRTLYYETEPVLTGGYSEVNRSRRVEMAQAEFREAMGDWSKDELDRYVQRHYQPYWLKTDLQHKIEHARFIRSTEQGGKAVATKVRTDPSRGVTELTLLTPDHPRLLSVIAGACAAAGANIVDAQIFTTTDGLALDSISVTREFDLDEDELRRANRIADGIEQALRGEMRLPDIVEKRAPKTRSRAFRLEPEVSINNEWSDQHTVIEVNGLDRPGLLFDLTNTISRLNLNIVSAHVATFGERVVDVFYVNDLMGAKIESPQRQASIKRALLAVFERAAAEEKPRKAAAAR
ncbi:MAG: [protein-PII] uridylyltransferase [Xanthobacteraceae bacterium]|nr:[protein-PII] uridylyltransferase [Xanthobacteraceae bacterium]QYK45132.1 MAG: [protein-PII] uridylyltransferase [Xanthobacteraceae bacterium]